MPPTIIRVAKDRNHPFVMIDRRLAEEPTLSWKAKGLMLYLLSRPDDWQVRVSDLVRRAPEGRAAVQTGLRELEQRGYIVRRRHHDAVTGRFTGIRLTVYERPIPSRTPHRPPLADEPQAEDPTVDVPQPEEPQMGDRPLTDTDITKTKPTKTQKPQTADVVPPMPPRNAPAPTATQTSPPRGRVAVSAGSAPTDAEPPGEAEAILAQVVALYEQEIGGCLTAMIHDELVDLVTHECRDPARWRAAFRASIGARNRWKYTRAIILHPDRKPPQEASHGTSQGPDQRRGRGRGGQEPRRGSGRRGAGKQRSVTLPGPEEIVRLNREAERQLRAASDPES